MTTPIRPGQVYRDNDPRTDRTVTVVAVHRHGDRALCESVRRFGDFSRSRKVWIALKRLHTDGKPRRSGFSLVTEE